MDTEGSILLQMNIPVTLNVIPFPQVYNIRQEQSKLIDLKHLSKLQWGLENLDKCHHISTTATSKDGPPSFRVRVCKTCCKNDSHIELGTYVDQESAVLVNDVHEILQERYDKLLLLNKEDKPYLHLFVAKKYDRHKGRDYCSILKILSERLNPIDDKKKRKRQNLDLNNNSNCNSNSSIYQLNNEMDYASNHSAIHTPIASSNADDDDHLSSSSSSGHTLVGSCTEGTYEYDESQTEDFIITDEKKSIIRNNITVDMNIHEDIHNNSEISTSILALSAEKSAYLMDSSMKTDEIIEMTVKPERNETFQTSKSLRNRPRAATFSVSSPMTTLSTLALLKDEELNAAALLSELSDGKTKNKPQNLMENEVISY